MRTLKNYQVGIRLGNLVATHESGFGPTLPSPAFDRNGSYRRMSCHQMDLRQVFAANLRGPRFARVDLQDVNRTYTTKSREGATYVRLEIIGKLAAVLKVEPAELLRLPPRRSRRK
jgi:hypothetical protein